jgi:DnaK suppressor protein
LLDINSIRTQLKQERDELLRRAEVPAETAHGDEADLAVMAENKERELWLANDAKQRLELIDKALARIDNGTYGKCVNCGRPIPEERLLTLPLTLYDVDCQGKLEKKVRR